MNLTSTVALRVPPEMMTELSLGMEDGVTVAQRYGFSAADFATLMGQPWFLKALRKRQEDLEANGFTFKAKMAMLAEDLLVDLWMAAKASESGSLKHDVAKLLAKLADLEPKPSASFNGAGGSGFTINISIPENWQEQVAASPARVASQEPQTPPTIDLTPFKSLQDDGLPAGSKPLAIPDFDFSDDLRGEIPDDGS